MKRAGVVETAVCSALLCGFCVALAAPVLAQTAGASSATNTSQAQPMLGGGGGGGAGGTGGGSGGGSLGCTGTQPTCDPYCQTLTCSVHTYKCTPKTGSCSSSACYTGQQCTNGTCGGGTPVSTAADVTHFAITSGNVTSGLATQFAIYAEDVGNNVVSAYNNTVSISITGTGLSSTFPTSVALSQGHATVTGAFSGTALPGTATVTVNGSKESICDPSAPTAGVGTYTVQPAPVQPTISTQGYINAGATSSASIVPQNGMTYTWSATGGTLLQTTGTTVSFTAGGSGSVGLSVVASNSASPPTSSQPGTASAVICSPPSTAFGNQCIGGTISASPTSVTMGQPTTLTVSGVTGLLPATERYQIFLGSTSLTCLASGTGTYSPTVNAATSTYSLVATSSCSATTGTTVATTTVTGAPSPSTPVITAPNFASQGQPGIAASVASQGAGITFSWSVSSGTITSAATGTSITFTAGGAGYGSSTLTVVAKNSATTPATATGHFTVATPLAGLYGATAVTQGTSQTLTWSSTALPGSDIYEINAGGTTVCESGASSGSYTYTAPTSPTIAFQIQAVTACNGTPYVIGTPFVVSTFPVPTPVITAWSTMTPLQTATASVPAQSGYSYAWSIDNGTITSAANTASIQYTALEPDSFVVLNCTLTSPAGTPGAAVPQTTAVSCGLGMKACASSCIAESLCCSAQDCSAPSWDGGTSGTVACGIVDAGVCSTTCGAGYTQCGDSCIPTGAGYCCE